MKIYIICPVRKLNEKLKLKLDYYVKKLEDEGHIVHYPPRDVDQTDDNCGLNICIAHSKFMKEAEEVHIWWDETSRGSLFDMGMAFIMYMMKNEPRFVIINKDNLLPTNHKSYLNVFLKISK